MLFPAWHEVNKSIRKFCSITFVTMAQEVNKSFIKENGFYCNHCMITGHHTRECPIPNCPLPELLSNFNSMYENNMFFFSKVKGKVKAKFIGKDIKSKKGKLPKQLWVPKVLVTHVQGPKLVWVPKTQY